MTPIPAVPTFLWEDLGQGGSPLPVRRPTMAVCLVTGGAGFIGSHLVDPLVAHGHTVRVLDNCSSGSLAYLSGVRSRVELVLGDLTWFDLVRYAVRGTDYVFHEAATEREWNTGLLGPCTCCKRHWKRTAGASCMPPALCLWFRDWPSATGRGCV